MIGQVLALLRRLVSIHYPYARQEDLRRARALVAIDGVVFLAGIFLFVFNTMLSGAPEYELLSSFVATLFAWIGSTVSYILVRRGHLEAALLATLAGVFLSVTAFVSFTGINHTAVLSYSVLVVLASALLGVQGLTLGAIGAIAGIVAIHLLHQAGTLSAGTVSTDSGLLGATLVAIDAAILWYFSRDRDAALHDALEAARRLRATSFIGQTAAEALELDAMLDQLVVQIRDQFDLYHVQIFLIEATGHFAVLEASTGEAGERLLDRGHRWEIGARGLIGQVTASGAPLVAFDADAASLHQRHEFLPKTRSELALPLRVGGRVIGALDLHSALRDAFNDDDVAALQVMANQLAITIENTRALTEQERRAEESRRLLQQAQVSLAEAERLNRRLIREAWDDYIEARAQDVIGITFDEGEVHSDTAWTPGLTLAAREGRPVLSKEGDRRHVSTPVQLGGEVIGAVEVELGPDMPPEDVLEVAQAVSTRLALTVQNARLVDQSQRQAQREYRLRAIASTVQGQFTVDDMLSVAVRELGSALGATRAAIRLGVRQTETAYLGAQRGNGNGQHQG